MWALRQAFVALLGLLAITISVGAMNSSFGLAVGVAAVLITVVVAARYAAVVMRGQNPGLSADLWMHRQALCAEPAPQHPDTAGRPRTRAPASSPSAA